MLARARRACVLVTRVGPNDASHQRATSLRASAPTDEATQDVLQLVHRDVHVLDDAPVERRGRNVAAGEFLLELVKAEKHDSLDARETVTHVGKAIEIQRA